MLDRDEGVADGLKLLNRSNTVLRLFLFTVWIPEGLFESCTGLTLFGRGPGGFGLDTAFWPEGAAACDDEAVFGMAEGGKVLWAMMCGATPGAWLCNSLFMSIKGLGWMREEMFDTPVLVLRLGMDEAECAFGGFGNAVPPLGEGEFNNDAPCIPPPAAALAAAAAEIFLNSSSAHSDRTLEILGKSCGELPWVSWPLSTDEDDEEEEEPPRPDLLVEAAERLLEMIGFGVIVTSGPAGDCCSVDDSFVLAAFLLLFAAAAARTSAMLLSKVNGMALEPDSDEEFLNNWLLLLCWTGVVIEVAALLGPPIKDVEPR